MRPQNINAFLGFRFAMRYLNPVSIRIRLFLGLSGLFLAGLVAAKYLSLWIVLPILFIGIHFLLLHFLEKPVRNLLQLTRRGGYDLAGSPHSVLGHDEFSRVARAVFGMARRMRLSLTEAKEQNNRLDEIFSSIGEGVIIVSGAGTLLKINNTMRRWVGWYGDVSGRRISEVLRSIELADRLAKMAQNIPTGADIERNIEAEVIENLHIEGPESRRVRVKIVPMRDEVEEIVFLVFLFDVTDMHRLELFRREFFANVSHELKTPISAIRGYAEILADQECVLGNSTAKQFVDVISRNTLQLTKLIDEMLVLAGLESGSLSLNLRVVGVKSTLARIRETMLPKAREAGVEIKVDVSDDIHEWIVDAQRMDSVLLNLIDNGIKYNVSGGYVKISVRKDSNYYLIYVEDSGQGIPYSSQPRAFERFYRVDKSHTRLGGGSGLGLAIVKHIVIAHGGTIALRSEEGVGTVFTVSLPLNPMNNKIDLLTPL